MVEGMRSRPTAGRSGPGRLATFVTLSAALTIPQVLAAQQVRSAGTAQPQAQCIRVEAIVRGSSEQSQRAVEFLEKFAQRKPGIALEIRDVEKDDEAEDRARQLLRDFRIKQPGLPVIHACRQLIVGFRDAETTGKRIEQLTVIDAYVRDGCPHCAAGKAFLTRMKSKYPGFTVRYHEIIKNPKAKDRLMELARHYRVQATNVPGFHFCGRLIIGYDRDETTGARLEAAMREACVPCPPQNQKDDATSARPRQRSPTVIPGFAFFGAIAPAFAVAQDSSASEENRDPSTDEDLPLGDAPLGDAPLGDAPLGDAPLGDAPLSDLPATEIHTLPPTENSDSAQSTSVNLPLFGEVDVRKLGLPLFTIAIGLVDGFNPCAMWVLLFLLSILVHLKDRRKILAVAGTFVLISGLAYFAFMAAWLNVFLLVGYLRWAQILLGLLAVVVGTIHVKDFFAFHKGISLSIPESAKPKIYERVRKIINAENLTGAVLGASVLAVLVNVIEMLCTAGLPALYTQILTMRELPTWANYAYLGLYNLAYMADDALMVTLVVVTLGRHKMQERHGRWLKLVSGLVVLALGLVLLFKPQWLELLSI